MNQLLAPGSRLGRYVVEALIGRGGMGAVYRAADTSLGRDVALKVLPPEVAADPDRLERFRREARALAALNHPNIVTIYSVDREEDVHFLTMELLTGTSLDRLLAGEGLPIERVRQIASGVADASWRHTAKASSIATSSRRTSSSPGAGRPKCSISGSRR